MKRKKVCIIGGLCSTLNCSELWEPCLPSGPLGPPALCLHFNKRASPMSTHFGRGRARQSALRVQCGVQLMHVLARAVQERLSDLPPWWLPQPNGKEIVKSLPPLLPRSVWKCFVRICSVSHSRHWIHLWGPRPQKAFL